MEEEQEDEEVVRPVEVAVELGLVVAMLTYHLQSLFVADVDEVAAAAVAVDLEDDGGDSPCQCQ